MTGGWIRAGLRTSYPEPVHGRLAGKQTMTLCQRLTIFLVTGIFLLGATSTSPAKDWKTFDRASYDWIGDTVPYEFVMRLPENIGAGDFTQLEIIRQGRVVLTVTDEDGISKYDEGIEQNSDMQKMAGKNLLPSMHLLMMPKVTGQSRFPLLFLFGWSYTSSPGKLHVIALGDEGVTKEILSLKHFYVRGLANLTNNPVPQLIGKKCFSQSWGEGSDTLTYDLYSVYRFGDTAISPMIFDLELSKKYNETNYHGWAGPNCREDVAVVLHPPGGGKPVIMDDQKAKALIKQ